MSNGFEFSLGQEVTMKAMLSGYPKTAAGESSMPQKLVILARVSEEREGGIHRYYRVRALAYGVSGWRGEMFFHRDQFTVIEAELAPWPAAPDEA